MKASAVAHPIQGLIKYHGLRDPLRRIPFHDSISVCTGGIETLTTVDSGLDDFEVEIDGKPTAGRALRRVRMVLDAVREAAGREDACKVVSRNTFPQYVGLGSSSSGFAALATAAAAAYEWDATPRELSEVARLGAGSASRAVTGGVSRWYVQGESSWSECIGEPESFEDWRIVVPLIPHEVPTEDVHQDAASSPLFEARVKTMAQACHDAERAARAGDAGRLWRLAELDTLNLHAITMTGASGLIAWQPGTLEIIHKIRALRSTGMEAFFSIDTGATPYINCHQEDVQTIRNEVMDIQGVREVLELHVGGPARLVKDHLF